MISIQVDYHLQIQVSTGFSAINVSLKIGTMVFFRIMGIFFLLCFLLVVSDPRLHNSYYDMTLVQ